MHLLISCTELLRSHWPGRAVCRGRWARSRPSSWSPSSGWAPSGQCSHWYERNPSAVYLWGGETRWRDMRFKPTVCSCDVSLWWQTNLFHYQSSRRLSCSGRTISSATRGQRSWGLKTKWLHTAKPSREKQLFTNTTNRHKLNGGGGLTMSLLLHLCASFPGNLASGCCWGPGLPRGGCPHHLTTSTCEMSHYVTLLENFMSNFFLVFFPANQLIDRTNCSLSNSL